MKNRIKIVEKGIIETNSSSSHSLIIGNDNFIKEGDEEWDIDIRNRILYIPNCLSFDLSFFKFNSCQRKLQYLSSLYFSDGNISVSFQKRIKKLKRMLCNIFKVDDVVFECIENYLKNELREELKDPEFDPYFCNFSPPTVDHESRCLVDEIVESEKTLSSYLFSRNSWVFGGSDNSSAPLGFLREKSTIVTNGTASIDFPGFGIVDFRIYYPGDLWDYITGEFKYFSVSQPGYLSTLDFLVYDNRNKVVIPVNYIEESYKRRYLSFYDIVAIKGNYYCMYTLDSVSFDSARFYNNTSKIEEEPTFKAINKYDPGNFTNHDEGYEYILFRINIKLDDINGSF